MNQPAQPKNPTPPQGGDDQKPAEDKAGIPDEMSETRDKPKGGPTDDRHHTETVVTKV